MHRLSTELTGKLTGKHSLVVLAALFACGNPGDAATQAVSALSNMSSDSDHWGRRGGDHGGGFSDHDAVSVPAPAEVPATLAVPAGNCLVAAYFGQGVQIYECEAAAGVYTWTFQAPQASLIDLSGVQHALHYAGPTWESTSDGSTVVGTVLDKVASPDPAAIPWLLLQAASHTGDGVFSRVTYVQRLSTNAGVAPATGCDATTVGSVVRMPYSAIYYFYAAANHR